MTRPRQQPNNPLTVNASPAACQRHRFYRQCSCFPAYTRKKGIFLADPRWETSTDSSIEQVTSLHFQCHLSPSMWHSVSVIIALSQTQSYHATRRAGRLCEAKSTAQIFGAQSVLSYSTTKESNYVAWK